MKKKAKESASVSGEKSPHEIAWREVALKAYIYIIFILIAYALFIGFKMSQMLSAREEIGSFLKSAHVHILTGSFLLLLIIYDLRLKRHVDNLAMKAGEPIIGIGVAGLIMVAAGFSVAALVPAMLPLGLKILHIGLPLLFFSFFGYAIQALISEAYK